MWVIGCLRWSAGDLCIGKKDATYILSQDVQTHTHTHSLLTKSVPVYINLWGVREDQTVLGKHKCVSCLISATVTHASILKGHHHCVFCAAQSTRHHTPHRYLTAEHLQLAKTNTHMWVNAHTCRGLCASLESTSASRRWHPCWWVVHACAQMQIFTFTDML